MDKSAEAFRTISEVADELGIPKHVLRFWEVKFTQIKPMKRGGGRRYYRPEDMELLRGVRHLLHRDGYTIKGVQKILREQGSDIVKALGRGETGAAVAPLPMSPATRGPGSEAPEEGTGATRSGRERTAQGRAGEGRAGEGRTGQERTGQGRADQSRPLAPSQPAARREKPPAPATPPAGGMARRDGVREAAIRAAIATLEECRSRLQGDGGMRPPVTRTRAAAARRSARG